MSDLTDEDIARCEQLSDFRDEEFWALLTEVKRHRAMVARLKEWAKHLANRAMDSRAPYIAAQIRDRMKGTK